MTTKRTDYLSWDEYFMAVAQLSALSYGDVFVHAKCCYACKAEQ
jgi:hypothetical protein